MLGGGRRCSLEVVAWSCARCGQWTSRRLHGGDGSVVSWGDAQTDLCCAFVRCNNDGSAMSWGERRWSSTRVEQHSAELEDATVLFFSEIVEVVRVASASICALSHRSTVDKQVIDVLMGWTRCPKGFVNTSSASQLHEVLEQVIEVPSWPCVFSLSGTGAESNFWALASVACAGPCVSRQVQCGAPMTLRDEDTLTVMAQGSDRLTRVFELVCAFTCATPWRCCTRCYGSREAAKGATPLYIPPICTDERGPG